MAKDTIHTRLIRLDEGGHGEEEIPTGHIETKLGVLVGVSRVRSRFPIPDREVAFVEESLRDDDRIRQVLHRITSLCGNDAMEDQISRRPTDDLGPATHIVSPTLINLRSYGAIAFSTLVFSTANITQPLTIVMTVPVSLASGLLKDPALETIQSASST